MQLFQEQETSQEQSWKHHLKKAGLVGAGHKHLSVEAGSKGGVETWELRVIQLYLHLKSLLSHDPRKWLKKQGVRVLPCTGSFPTHHGAVYKTSGPFVN